jgi:hypothetical protein
MTRRRSASPLTGDVHPIASACIAPYGRSPTETDPEPPDVAQHLIRPDSPQAMSVLGLISLILLVEPRVRRQSFHQPSSRS